MVAATFVKKGPFSDLDLDDNMDPDEQQVKLEDDEGPSGDGLSLVRSPARVLAAVRAMVSMEVACEPEVVATLRGLYEGHATLWTYPTNLGKEEIDPFHKYHGLQHLRGKPVKHLLQKPVTLPQDRYMFLQIQKAAEEGYLKYVVLPGSAGHGLPPPAFLDEFQESEFMDGEKQREEQNLKQMRDFLNDAFVTHHEAGHATVMAWNQERERIVDETLKKRLIPAFRMDMERQLRAASQEAVLDATVENLNKILEIGPFQPQRIANNRGLLLTEPRQANPSAPESMQLKACAFAVESDNKLSSFMVAVDAAGDVVDHVAVPGGIQVG